MPESASVADFKNKIQQYLPTQFPGADINSLNNNQLKANAHLSFILASHLNMEAGKKLEDFVSFSGLIAFVREILSVKYNVDTVGRYQSYNAFMLVSLYCR